VAQLSIIFAGVAMTVALATLFGDGVPPKILLKLISSQNSILAATNSG
jgi:hypothetical protein